MFSNKVILPSELVDRVLAASDLLTNILNDLITVSESQSTESPVLRSLCESFDAALGRVNSTLDGERVDMDSYLNVKRKANVLKEMWLLSKVRKHEVKSYQNVSSSFTPVRENQLPAAKTPQNSCCCDSETSSLTNTAASQDNLSGAEDEIHAPTFPLFKGAAKKAVAAEQKTVKVVTPASTHDMIDLTGRRARTVSYTKPESAIDVIVIDDEEESEDEDGNNLISPVVSSETSSRIKAVRMLFHSEQLKRQSARLGFSSPSSSSSSNV
jgi:hypothetical protein